MALVAGTGSVVEGRHCLTLVSKLTYALAQDSLVRSHFRDISQRVSKAGRLTCGSSLSGTAVASCVVKHGRGSSPGESRAWEAGSKRVTPRPREDEVAQVRTGTGKPVLKRGAVCEGGQSDGWHQEGVLVR